jgi:phage gpG-like protein
MSAPAVRIDGLKELRQGFRVLEPEIGKELQGELKAAVALAAVRAASLAPRRSGALAASYRPFAAGNRAGVRSRLPYAGVQEFGGTIRPKGTAITIRPHRVVLGAIDDQAERILDHVSDAIDRACLRAGWK